MLMSDDEVELVRGGAAPEELAAVVAVLRALGDAARPGDEPTGYAAWRRTRLAAIAASGVR
jgi:hypothetical protein